MKKFKKAAVSAAAILLAATLMGCAGETAGPDSSVPTGATGSSAVGNESSAPAKTTGAPADTGPSKPLGERTLTDLIDEIYAGISGVEFPTVVSREISLAAADKDMFRYIFGIDPPAGAVAAAASEPMIGSIPYTMALLQMEDGSDVAAVAASVKAGVDPNKWVCVWAEVVETACHGNVILLIMDNDEARAQAVLTAFDKVMS